MAAMIRWLAGQKVDVFKDPKIFCISFQRTGTTSVGRFFADHGYSVGTWHVTVANGWSVQWFKGDHDRIFASAAFKSSQVFEDAPWGGTDFYKILFHRFPNSRFVHLERPAGKWFDSMVSHSKGRTLGNTHRHACLYDRKAEYYALGDLTAAYTSVVDNLLPLGEEQRAHYEAIYTGMNKEVKLFFDRFGNERLFSGELNDPDLWKKMGAFFDVRVKEGYNSHANASPSSV